ncbi:hypothetical protein NQD34_000068 [Periophthalmus magnuspinnatus]|nr:hypothetical protein NQD34_000068 [Periophthalmus magnuspinnatus]
MSDTERLALWTLALFSAHAVCCVSAHLEVLARDSGDVVVLSCRVDHTSTPPFGVYLKRSRLRPGDVLFKYEDEDVSVRDGEYHNRTSVTGDPKIHEVNVTIRDLRPTDTDQYHCEFNFNNPTSEDTVQRGTTEYFIYVRGVVDVDRDWVHTCVGGSTQMPCLPPVGDDSSVEGVVLKRQKGRGPVELLYHSQRTSRSSHFSEDRVRLVPVPGPGGISYSLTVDALRPEDSGLYSCQLLLQGRPPSPAMGPQGVYVSVQDDQCGCSSYSALIYALSAAVAVTFVLLVVALLVHRGSRPRAKATPNPAPIYEEMTGLKPKSPKRSRGFGDELPWASEYRNITPKDEREPRPENHYESPNGAIESKPE